MDWAFSAHDAHLPHTEPGYVAYQRFLSGGVDRDGNICGVSIHPCGYLCTVGDGGMVSSMESTGKRLKLLRYCTA